MATANNKSAITEEPDWLITSIAACSSAPKYESKGEVIRKTTMTTESN